MIPVTITPVVPITPTNVPNFQASQVLSDLANVPPGIAVLPTGAILSGFVLNRDPAGNPVLRTMYGDFLLKSQAFLKIGADVTIRIEASGKYFKAAITQVNGQPVSAVEGEPTAEERAPLASGSATTIVQPTTSQPAKNSTQLQAVLLAPSPEAENIPQLKTGAKLALQVVQSVFPGQVGAETSDILEPLQALQTKAQSPISTPVQTTTLTLNQVVARVVGQVSVQPSQVAPDAQIPTTATPTPPATIPALVIGQEKDGEAVVSTPLGLIKITSHATLPTGTQLTLTLTSLTPADTVEDVANPQILTLSQRWPTLEGLLKEVAADADGLQLIANSGLPVASLAAVLPTTQQSVPPNTVSAGTALFMQMLGVGNVREWLGPKLVKRMEEKGLHSELKQLQSEFSSLQKLAAEPSNNSWQTMFVPLFANGEVQMVRMFSKRKRREGDGEPENHVRFIVEMQLSQLGEMQLDGLVRKATQAKPAYLEMVVRAHQPLPQDAQSELLRLFSQVNDSGILEGSLHFQWMRQFPVQPLSEAFDPPTDVLG